MFVRLRSMMVDNAVDSYYDKLEEMCEGKPTMRDPNDFTFVDGNLRLKRFPKVIFLKQNGEQLRLSSIDTFYQILVVL